MPGDTHPPRPLQVSRWARAFAIASLIHLTLPDFDSPGWGPPQALGALGALWLLLRPGPGGFALSAASSLWTLLLLRDVLTQSALLTVMALAGLAGSLGWRGALDAVRLCAAGTYALAALHKLNTGFFDPDISCAVHAAEVVGARWPALPSHLALPLGVPLAASVVAVELALAWGTLRRRPWIWPLAILFHLPLTATLAPAFEAVMLAGLAASLTPRQLARWRRALRRRWPWLIAAGLATAALDHLAAAPPLHLGLSLKLAANGALTLLALFAWPPRPRDPRPRDPRPAPRAARLVAALWLAHGMTPYLGLQYQHTGAMLSNLRIDDPCHNSLVIPRALRLGDPYLRIDRARFADGARPERAHILETTLWHLAALHTMRRNWCVDHLRPIHLEGSWRGRPFTLPDLCAADWHTALPGAAAWPAGLQLFQKNLRRACDTPCVH